MDDNEQGRPTGRRGPVLIAAGLGACVAIAVAAYLLLRRPPEAPTQVAAPQPPVDAGAPAEAPLPPTTESDASVRRALTPLSTRPEWKQWLASDDLLTRIVTVADNLAEGTSPRAQLPFLAPKGGFTTVTKRGREFISPKSYARYDVVADVVSSIDVVAAGAAYRELKPLLDAAYRKLGYPGADFGPTLARALRRVASVPVREGDVEVVPKGARYLFADEALEKLRPADKHLLRTGPRNLRLLQAKALELGRALALPGF